MKKHLPTKDLRDIGQAIPFIVKMDSFRELPSCCTGPQI